jgi:hypothetical protein
VDDLWEVGVVEIGEANIDFRLEFIRMRSAYIRRECVIKKGSKIKKFRGWRGHDSCGLGAVTRDKGNQRMIKGLGSAVNGYTSLRSSSTASKK